MYRWPSLFLLIILSSCKMAPENSPNPAAVIESMAHSLAQQNPQVQHLSAQELQALKGQQKIILIDVRSQEERNYSTIAGALELRDLRRIIAGQQEITDKKIVLYDTIGLRAVEQIKAILADHPASSQKINLYNLKGGILGWIHHGLPIVNPEGIETFSVHTSSSAWNIVPKHYKGVTP